MEEIENLLERPEDDEDPENRYYKFNMKDTFDGTRTSADFWISKLVATCNKYRLTNEQAIESARGLMKLNSPAHLWFEKEYTINYSFKTF